jgi:glycosyltransferase involved in cell wall biosynthesis
MATISVLMATYTKERPERLHSALESVFSQTRPVDQLVLVVDGPIGLDQEEVIESYKLDARLPEFRVVRLPVNGGLAAALNAGLASCTGEYIMRMDSDDISEPDRASIQVRYADEHPEVDAVFGWVEEFFEDSSVTRIRSSPITHEAIIHALRWRNVLSHPTMLIKASVLRGGNGYRTNYPLLEDWDLYVRLLATDARFAVIPKVVVRMLVSNQVKRRGGLRYVANETLFRTFCFRVGFLSIGQYLVSTAAYAAYRLAGRSARGVAYCFVRNEGLRANPKDIVNEPVGR